MTPVPDIGLIPDTKPEPAPAPSPPPAWVNLALKILGFVVALGLAAVTALYEAFYSALRLGGYRLPFALVVAVVANLGLVWFTHLVTGRRITVAGPALVWVAVLVVASSRTSEGDLLLVKANWVGSATMLLGSVAFAVGAYRLILAGLPPPRSEPAPPE